LALRTRVEEVLAHQKPREKFCPGGFEGQRGYQPHCECLPLFALFVVGDSDGDFLSESLEKLTFFCKGRIRVWYPEVPYPSEDPTDPQYAYDVLNTYWQCQERSSPEWSQKCCYEIEEVKDKTTRKKTKRLVPSPGSLGFIARNVVFLPVFVDESRKDAEILVMVDHEWADLAPDQFLKLDPHNFSPDRQSVVLGEERSARIAFIGGSINRGVDKSCMDTIRREFDEECVALLGADIPAVEFSEENFLQLNLRWPSNNRELAVAFIFARMSPEFRAGTKKLENSDGRIELRLPPDYVTYGMDATRAHTEGVPFIEHRFARWVELRRDGSLVNAELRLGKTSLGGQLLEKMPDRLREFLGWDEPPKASVSLVERSLAKMNLRPGGALGRKGKKGEGKGGG
jgi:hypothetical protein